MIIKNYNRKNTEKYFLVKRVNETSESFGTILALTSALFCARRHFSPQNASGKDEGQFLNDSLFNFTLRTINLYIMRIQLYRFRDILTSLARAVTVYKERDVT